MAKEVAYPNMFSPIKVGNVLLRSRFYASQSKPHSVQGPETWPAEGFFRHYINKAKNGAAYVTMSGGMKLGPPVRTQGRSTNTMLGHFPGIDIYDSTVQNYLAQLSDALHFEGAAACMMINRELPGYDVDDNVPPFIVEGDGGGAGFIGEMGKRINEKQMQQLADEYALEAVILQDAGFDMVYAHSAYRLMLPSRFLSKRTNTRDDEFGPQSMENRSRFLFMICDRIHERCGKGFPIEIAFTAIDEKDPDPEKWWTLDDTREFVNLAKGHIDILQVRPFSVEYVHNMGFEPPLPTKEAAKVAHEAANGEILISSVSGYCHPDLAEPALDPKTGYLDLVGMTRSFISNPNWGELCAEGRTKEIVPCIKCNKCHRNSYSQSHLGVCSVNPLFGKEHRVDYLKVTPKSSKHLAIVGGGPAGMRAAMFATANGHKVTLFEKSDKLGGLLNINQFCNFKWPLANYNKWLIERTMENPDIEVKLNTEATRELLQQGDYDEIFAAIGAEKVVPRIPGADKANVMWATDVYGHMDLVGENVVIIGGGDVGVETGFYLTHQGNRKVFVIEMMDRLMPDATPIHYRVRFVDEWEADQNFSFAVNAKCTQIGDGTVTYEDAEGVHTIPADTVLYSVGMKAKEEEALGLYWPGKRIHLIGDCKKAGNVQTCNRDAFYAANTLL